MPSISMPKAEKKILSTFTPEQISKLTSVCLVNKKMGFRGLVMIMLMLDSGLRVSELVNLQLEDICLSEGCITVQKGKGNKERIVPIESVVQKMPWKYINQE